MLNVRDVITEIFVDVEFLRQCGIYWVCCTFHRIYNLWDLSLLYFLVKFNDNRYVLFVDIKFYVEYRKK